MSIIKAFIQLWHDEHYRAHFLLAFVMLLLGSLFYHFYEGWRFIDAVYFSVTTLTTVGYGDLHPTTDLGKLFTIFYIMVGIGILLSFLNLFAEKMIKARKDSIEQTRKLKKELKNTYKKLKKDE